MQKVYFDKIQKTTDYSITKFYFNKNKKLFNNLAFLLDKIDALLASDKVTESVKKQLNRIKFFDFKKYDCFYIYSNNICFAIDSVNKTIDFYNNDYDSIIDKKYFESQNYNFNYNCKITSQNNSQNTVIDSSDFESEK